MNDKRKSYHPLLLLLAIIVFPFCTHYSPKVFLDSKDHFGIDISCYQELIDWNTVKETCSDNIDFIYNYKFNAAKYNDNPSVIKNGATYAIWQFSNRGRVCGIKTNVNPWRFHPSQSLDVVLMPPKKINNHGETRILCVLKFDQVVRLCYFCGTI